MRNIYFCLIGFILCIAIQSCKEEAENQENPTVNKPSNPQFELLDATASGIHFSNSITETFQDNILINSYLYNGGGVGVIDINNDGLQDLYFSATQESNKLFLNKGNLQFEDITDQAGVAVLEGVKTGVSIVDVNADGWQDIYVCRSGLQPGEARKNLLFINNGNLTFTESADDFGLGDRAASNHANFFDYDLDGDLDVYVLNHPVDYANVNKANVTQDGNNYIRISTPAEENIWDSDNFYRNEGNGKFTNIGKEAGIFNRAWGLSVTVSDFNRDGYPDVFVGNDYIEPDLLYINDTKGRFSIETDKYFRHLSNHTMGVDIADINNDALIDLVALDMVAEDYSRQKQLMTTMMFERYNSLVRFGYGHQVMRNVLQLNTGKPVADGYSFSEIGVVAGISNTDWSWSPLLFDADNDGLKDLHVTNGYRRDVSNLDYLTYTSPQLAPGGRFDVSKTPTMADYLNHIPSQPLSNFMYKNEDGKRFNNVSSEWVMDQKGFSNGSAYADLDNDGDLDLIVNNIQDDVMIYKNLTNQKNNFNWLQISLEGPTGNNFGVGSKVSITLSEGDIQYQEMNPIRGFLSSSQSILHFGLGDNKTVAKVEITWPDGKTQYLTKVSVNQNIAVKYNPDIDESFAETNFNPFFEKIENLGINFQHKEDVYEDFNSERLNPQMFSRLGPCISKSDVNGDGLDDLFIGGAAGQSGKLFLQHSSSNFLLSKNQPWADQKEQEDNGALFFDADADGDQDLYVASGGNSFESQNAMYQDRLYINDGKGNFSVSENALPALYNSTSALLSIDFDMDGDLDLIVGGRVSPKNFPLPPISSILVNSNGKFTDYAGQIAPDFQKIGMVTDLAWADLNGDGENELIVCGEWMPITVFQYIEGKFENRTNEFGLSNSNGWWKCVELADLDNDGDVDIAAGNIGKNIRYKTSESEPLKMYAKDFDRNGSMDPVITFLKNGNDYPYAQRDMLIKQMPALKKKYVYYKDYSTASIQDIFSDEILNDALKLQISTLATSWFENKNGKFILHELPFEIQVSPTNDLQIEDFNNDGFLDILAVGNDYTMDVETGRCDAGSGTLLLGNGNGSFEYVNNPSSGFWAVRDARKMAQLKLANGKTIIVVVNNNDRVESHVLK